MSEGVAAPAIVPATSALADDMASERPNENGITNGDGHQTTEAPASLSPAQALNGTDAVTSEAVNGPISDALEKTSDAVVPDVPMTIEEPVKQDKRKSGVGASQSKGKKLTKKKSMPTLHLSCQPGEYYWARMKGHAPWPAIIAAEDMLPEALLATRPVSTTRPDGSLREDYRPDGKNAKERSYAVMYLATNEFSWINNTNIAPLDPEECKQPPKTKAKHLAEAYQLAVEQHDLEYYRDLLATAHEERRQIEEELQRAEAEAQRKADERASKAEEKKKKPRKSKGVEDDDIEMDDAEAPKSSKKRKKVEESDGEGIKPKKTPKVTKLNGPKTPAEADTPTGKKENSKPKKKVTAPKVEPEEPEVKVSDEERTERSILYFRHRLQKGFISRDDPPRESEMAGMAEYFAQLEHHENLPPAIIRSTKIHKVLKAIVKLDSIPKEEEYNFKKRSAALLEIWNKRMEADGESVGAKTTSADKPTKNNVVVPPEAKSASETAEKTEKDAVKSTEGQTAAEHGDGDSEVKPSQTIESSKPETEVASDETPVANGETAKTQETEPELTLQSA